MRVENGIFEYILYFAMKDYAKMILSLPVCSKTGRYLKKKNPSDTECQDFFKD